MESRATGQRMGAALAVAVAVAVVGVAVSVPARAAAATDPRHCTVEASVSPDGPQPPVQCFDSFRKAISHATAGAITDAPHDAHEAVSDESFRRRLNALGRKPGRQAQLVIDIEYQHSAWRGSTYTIYAAHDCTPSKEDEDFYLRQVKPEWNDQISSFFTTERCYVKHFEHIDFGGASVGYEDSQGELGIFNDATSSLKFS